MKKRKLMIPSAYSDLSYKLTLGVPLSRVLRQSELDISRPLVSRLLNHFENSLDYSDPDTAVRIHNSLFPSWLIKDGPVIQEQPDGWTYVGYFPLGEWVNGNN